MMRTIILKSDSETKLNLLIQVAKQMGVETSTELTDEDMSVPGKKITEQQFDTWILKDDGEEYEVKEAFAIGRKELSSRRRKIK